MRRAVEEPGVEPVSASRVTLRVRVVASEVRVRFGHPLGGPDLTPLGARDDPDGITVAVPDFDTWRLLLVEG